eukprot:gnl/TRDRNA2_/TRDRNA2_44822_c0_seq1.p1 gnl/TRDRNA2_/TRDRNA2_44822_c0~~gnl/TRDRNA2_/TRDRNA2_44822_c0_seq1.p1  ORF type:complete len:377 (-),score=84.93 gnl/TRDRNA2_/TRDRNA2_44822_c0_seq1:425-1534(-)
MGLVALHRFSQNDQRRKQRGMFARWARRTEVEHLAESLKEQYNEQIPNVEERVHKMGLPQRCETLDSELTRLQDEKVSAKFVEECVAEIDKKIAPMADMQIKLVAHDGSIGKIEESQKEQSGKLSSVDKKVQDSMQQILAVETNFAEFAKATKESLAKDILLVWNSVKQLDVAKADKKDIDSFALETSNRDQLSGRRLEDFQAELRELAGKAREEGRHAQEKWSQVHNRLDETTRQITHWEGMWDKLSSFVEDIVGKVAELQGVDAPGRSSFRSANRASSRERNRQEIPQLPIQADGGGPDGSAGIRGASPTRNVTGDAADLWAKSAKPFVDASIDQAMSRQSSSARLRLPPRPKSATNIRRPHDRARC